MSNLYRLVQAYLAKKSVLSHESAIEMLERQPKHVIFYYTNNVITKEEAQYYASKSLPHLGGRDLAYFFSKGLLDRTKAKTRAKQVLPELFSQIDHETLAEMFRLKLVELEDIKPFILKQVRFSSTWRELGALSADEYLDLNKDRYKDYPWALSDDLKFNRIHRTDALRALAEDLLEKRPDLSLRFYLDDVGIDLSKLREAAKAFLSNAEISTIEDFVREGGPLTKEDLLPFVRQYLKQRPHFLGYLTRDKSPFTPSEVKVLALEILENVPSLALRFIREGFITKQDAKSYVIKHLKKDPSGALEALRDGYIDLEAAKTFFFEHAKQQPNQVEFYLQAGYLTEAQANQIRDWEKAAQLRLKSARPPSYEHVHAPPTEPVKELTYILGVMKKLKKDKLSWVEFQEQSSVSSKKLEDLFRRFKGGIITKTQCEEAIENAKNREQHKYKLTYETWGRGQPQVSLAGHDQTVVKLHLPKTLLSKLTLTAQHRLADLLDKMHFTDAPFAWARVVKLEDKWFIEEIQSDVDSKLASLRHRNDPEDREFLKEVSIVQDWYEVILSAIMEAARDSGIHEIYMHTADTKLAQEDVGINEAKARRLYDRVPQKMMFTKKTVDLGGGAQDLWHRIASKK